MIIHLSRRSAALSHGIALMLVLCPQLVRADLWNLHGPKNCTEIPGGCSGRTRWLCVHPDVPTTYFAGHEAGGLWRSTDSGGNWTHLHDGAIASFVYRKAVGPTDVDRMIIGTAATGSGDGIYTSIDGGLPWVPTLTFAEGTFVWVDAMAVVPGQNVVLAGTSRGLYRSTTGGTSWVESPLGTSGMRVSDAVTHPGLPGVAFVAMTPNTLPFTGTPGVYRTTDSGASWTPVSDPDFAYLSVSDWASTVLAWAPSDPTKIYFTAWRKNPNRPAMIARSFVANVTDVGGNDSWDVVWTDTGCGFDPPCYSVTYGNFESFAVAKDDPLYLYLGGSWLHRSLDGGSTWDQLFPTNCSGNDRWHQDIHYILPVPGAFLLATDGGIYYHEANRTLSDCSLDMHALNNGYYSLLFYEMATDPGPAFGDVIYAGTQDQASWGRGIDDLGNEEWRRLQGNEGSHVAMSNDCLNCVGLLDGAHVYYLNVFPSFMMWTSCVWYDDPNAYSKFITIPGETFGGPILVNPLDSSEVFFFGSSTLYLLDGNCTPVNQGPVPGFIQSAVIAGNSVDGAVRIYAYSTAPKGLHRITVGSPLIVETLAMPWASNSPVTDLSLKPGATANKDLLYVTLGSYTESEGNVWKYAAKTATWTAIGQALPHVPAHSVLVDPQYATRLHVGTRHGTYFSGDGGVTWSNSRFDLPDVEVQDLKLHQGTRALYAGTWGRSIWKTFPDTWPTGEGSENTWEEVSQRLRDFEVQLRQVDGRIRFSVARAGTVEITLHDVNGRRIKELLSERVGVGEHELMLDFSNVTRGMYFGRVLFEGYQVDAMKFIIQ